jgi:hypothetical protein
VYDQWREVARQENTVRRADLMSRQGHVAAVSALRVAGLMCVALVVSGPLRAQPATDGDGPPLSASSAPTTSAGSQRSGPSGADGAQGGGANADFDSLIDLIESTVAPETWADSGGGDAAITPFPTGVVVDAAATITQRQSTTADNDLDRLRGTTPPTVAAGGDPRRASTLRYVSLSRLEREIIRRQAAHKPLDAAMLTLAGLQRVRYLFLYPESGDLVLAGPAGDWRVDPAGHVVSTDTGEPVVRLDDLLVLLRRASQAADSQFGCSITPRQEALARTQAYLDKTRDRAIEQRDRQAWLDGLRQSLGRQDVSIWGVDPASRVARVLVSADYHMKLIGMGLAEGVDGVPSYLASIPPGGAPPMTVLRWWFTLNYEAVTTSANGNAYELVGQGVKVLSENEMLAAQGRRVHTGQSEPLNRQFAERFTAHFVELADKHPIYAELRNVFDLALVMALVEHDHLAERVGWKPTLLLDAERLRLPAGPVPRQVDSVINHRVMSGGRKVIAGVSGGVVVATSDAMKQRSIDQTGALAKQHGDAPANLDASAWWWDAPE